MSPAATMLLALQAGLALLWGIEAYRLLFRLSGRARAGIGRPLPGPGAMLRTFAAFAVAPEDARARRRFVGLTAALLAASVAFALVAGPVGDG